MACAVRFAVPGWPKLVHDPHTVNIAIVGDDYQSSSGKLDEEYGRVPVGLWRTLCRAFSPQFLGALGTRPAA